MEKMPRMKPLVTLGFTLGLVLAASSSAHASLVTFRFEGEVSSVDSELLGPFSIGEMFTGTYTFDSDALTDALSSSVPPVYVWRDAITEISFTMGEYVASATNGNIIYDIEDPPGYYEANSFGPWSASPVDNDTLFSSRLSWVPSRLQATPPVDPAFTPEGNFLVTFKDPLDRSHFVIGTLSSVSAIPIPSAVYLFGTGLIALIGIARKKAAQ